MTQRTEYQKALDLLKVDVLKMGGMAEETIAIAMKALVEQDIALGDKVFELEEGTDEMEIKIEETCIRLIATQQPMAKDLRQVGSIFKITTDLERVGDYSVDIVKIARSIGKEPLIKPLIDIPRMAELAQKMIKEVLDAYVIEDSNKARQVGAIDDQIDKLHKQVLNELLILMMEKPANISQATKLLFVSRYLERIGDHITNIAERIVYMVEGERVDLNT